MAASKKNTKASAEMAQRQRAQSLAVSETGVKTGQDFANLMSALMTDLISGRVTPQIGNAVCNVGGKLLKVVELQAKFGTPQAGGSKVLQLAMSQPLIPADAVQ